MRVRQSLSSPGTKAHQRARRAVAKRQPAIEKDVGRFNKLVRKLNRRRPCDSTFPLFEPLPTDIASLRNSELLFQELWMASANVPDWARDRSVRDGIRAVQTIDRCNEEIARMDHELKNMTRWYTVEYLALQLLATTPEGTHVFGLTSR